MTQGIIEGRACLAGNNGCQRFRGYYMRLAISYSGESGDVRTLPEVVIRVHKGQLHNYIITYLNDAL